MRITAEAARRFLVARHFLAPARSLEGGLDAVLEVFRKFGAILSRSAPRILAENAEVAERVLERFRAEGPLSALDFERERGATTDWFGMPTNTVRAVLEALTIT